MWILNKNRQPKHFTKVLFWPLIDCSKFYAIVAKLPTNEELLAMMPTEKKREILSRHLPRINQVALQSSTE